MKESERRREMGTSDTMSIRRCMFFVMIAVIPCTVASRHWHRQHQLRSCRDHLVAALRYSPRAHKQGTKKGKEAQKETHLRERFSEPLLLEIPTMAAGGVVALLSVGGRNGACGHLIGEHERKQPGQSVR